MPIPWEARPKGSAASTARSRPNPFHLHPRAPPRISLERPGARPSAAPNRTGPTAELGILRAYLDFDTLAARLSLSPPLNATWRAWFPAAARAWQVAGQRGESERTGALERETGAVSLPGGGRRWQQALVSEAEATGVFAEADHASRAGYKSRRRRRLKSQA